MLDWFGAPSSDFGVVAVAIDLAGRAVNRRSMPSSKSSATW